MSDDPIKAAAVQPKVDASPDPARPGLVTDSSPVREEKREGTGAPITAPPKKKARRKKPGHTEFVQNVRGILGGTSQVAATKGLQKLLKRGVQANTPLGLLVDEVFAIVRDWPGCSRLALALSAEIHTTRPSELIRNLRNHLISHAHSVVDYPDSPAAAADQHELAEAVSTWLERIAERMVPKDAEKDRRASDMNIARRAAVCLLDGPTMVRTEGIYRLLEATYSEPKRDSPVDEESAYFAEVGAILGAEKLSVPKVAGALRLVAGARANAATIGHRLWKMQKALTEKGQQLDRVDAERMALTQSLADATARVTELGERLQTQSEELERQKVERGLDREHLQAVADQQHSRKMAELSARLAHEITEARICLDNDSPNLRMALERLRQMERILGKMRDA